MGDAVSITKPSRRSCLRWFVREELISASFPIAILTLIIVTDLLRIPGLNRYDFLLLACLTIQAVMVLTKMETWLDALVMLSYHLMGLGLEIVKVNHGSWAYPEPGFFKVANVPLFSGFMYASAASYMSVAWRRMHLQVTDWPGKWWSGATLILVYGQFFLPSTAFVIRIAAALILGFVFRKAKVYFALSAWKKPETQTKLNMPLNLAFVCIGIGAWLAENIGTRFHAWVYPYQSEAWQPVHFTKVVSWTLMVVVSVTIMYWYKEVIKRLSGVPTAD